MSEEEEEGNYQISYSFDQSDVSEGDKQYNYNHNMFKNNQIQYKILKKNAFTDIRIKEFSSSSSADFNPSPERENENKNKNE